MLTNAKFNRLKSILGELGSALVAYSGGTDSTFLARVAHDILGERMLAVQVSGEVFSAEETARAEETAVREGFCYRIQELDFLGIPGFVENSPRRCYYCRKAMFARLRETADRHGLVWIINGDHEGDLAEYRPGRRAALENGVRSPLIEAGLGKQEIRELSRVLGLPSWSRAASPCLASRIPFGTPVTTEILRRVEAGEACIHEIGIEQVRLRHYGDTARIEVPPQDMPKLLEVKVRESLVAHLVSLGYRYVTMDLEGYRTGSLNTGTPVSKE